MAVFDVPESATGGGKPVAKRQSVGGWMMEEKGCCGCFPPIMMFRTNKIFRF